jgi:hypothetical protein
MGLARVMHALAMNGARSLSAVDAAFSLLANMTLSCQARRNKTANRHALA